MIMKKTFILNFFNKNDHHLNETLNVFDLFIYTFKNLQRFLEKFMRTRRKKINPTLRSNINKKMIQLHRIIFELQSTSEHLKFQKEFICDFFNPRIDNAINAYREHMSKMQKVALEDYDFIIDRTDRFYQRKYQNLLKSYSEEVDSLRNSSITAVNELDNEKQNALQLLSQFRNKIIIFEKDSQKEIEGRLNKFKFLVDKTKEEGEIKFKTEMSNLQLREQKFISESEQKHKKMMEDHLLLIELIKSGFIPPKLNISTIKSKIKDIKKCISGYKSNLQSLQTYALKQISVNRNKINQLIKDLKLLMMKNQDEQISIQKVLDSQNSEFGKIIQQLKQNFDLIKQQYLLEIEQKLNELNSLKIQLQKEYDDRKNGLSQNDLDDEMQLSNLKKALDEELQSIMSSFENERKKMIQKVEDLQKQIELFIVQSEELINQLKNQLTELIEAHKSEIDDYKSTFNKEKEELLKSFEKELRETIEQFKKSTDENTESEAQLKLTIKELENEKENLKTIHEQQINEFDGKTAQELNDIQNETNEKVSTLENQIESMLDDYSKSLDNEILETIEDNEKKKSELIQNLTNQYESEMTMIRESGYSKAAYEHLLKKYQDEHLKLVEQLKQMVPFVITDDMFANMLLVINDLEKELQDHMIIASSQKRCINLEGEKKYDDLQKKITNLQQKTQNSRARNQTIQSIKIHIARAIKTKEETLSQLNNEYSQLFVSNRIRTRYNINDDEINKLNDKLSEVIKDSENSISEALSLTEQKKKSLCDEFSSQIQILNDEIKNVVSLTQQQNSFYQIKMNELNNTSNINKMNYNQSYENSVNYYLNVFDNMKRNFLESEHVLRLQIKDQSFQNSRNHDSYRSNELEEHRKHVKSLNETEEQNNEYLLNKQKIKDDMLSKINDFQSRKGIIVRKANDVQPQSPEKDKIEKLEHQLKVITNKLNVSLQDLIECKNIYMNQEKKINQSFKGNQETGSIKLKQNCVNYDVI